MHMSDALLSPATGVVMCAASAAAMAYSTKQINKDELCEKKIPVMAVMGAFVFAAQMINFTIPATGSSGHIGGGILLAACLGPFASLLSIAAVLIIQCLFFADGGLLALGCNIFNMGVIPCLFIYPLLFKPILKKEISITKISLASILCVVVSLQLGAFCVVLQTAVSGISALPLGAFLYLMQPIHLAIGIVEGIITAAVLCYVYKSRPEIIESALYRAPLNKAPTIRKTVIAIGVSALIIGGALSLLASGFPDGLEWSIEKTAGEAELEAQSELAIGAAKIQQSTSILPDYTFKNEKVDGTSVAGLVGTAMTFAVAGLTALFISRAKKKGKESA